MGRIIGRVYSSSSEQKTVETQNKQDSSKPKKKKAED